MQTVRCDACGTRAILAASRCPKCGHPLDLRDHHGDFLSMARCRACDSHYLRAKGRCKWCGPADARSRSPRVVAGISALLFVLAAWGARELWFTGGESPEDVAQVTAVEGSSGGELALADRTVGSQRVQPRTSNGTLSAAEVSPTRLAPPTTGEPVRPTPPVDVTVGAEGPWTPMRATTFVNVRAGPDVEGTVVGVVNPDARVFLGTSRGSWRRLQAPGISGWVDSRLFQRVNEERPPA